MQKRKVDGKWQTELLKGECKKLMDAASVLSDLADIEPTCAATRDCVASVLKCISVDGIYSEKPSA